MIHTEDWEAFKLRIFGTPYMIWHDGVPDCTRELGKEDARHVTKMILEGLVLEDYVAVEALKMVAIPDMIPDLILRLEKAIGRFRIELAVFLQEKAPPLDDRYAKEVVNELRHPSWLSRIDAAISLRHFPLEYVGEALLETVGEDPDYLVRYHCANSYLLLIKADPKEIFAYKDIFPLITTPEDTKNKPEDYERYKQASEELRALKA